MSVEKDSYDLVEKFINVLEDVGKGRHEVKQEAKRCALISIEEQIKTCILGEVVNLDEMRYFIKNQM